jgi:HK97 family phage major capsid protein
MKHSFFKTEKCDGMMWRKIKNQRKNQLFAVCMLVAIAAMVFVADILSGSSMGCSMAGIGLLASIQSKGGNLSDEDKKRFEAIDNALEDVFSKAFERHISNEGLKVDVKSLKAEILDEMNKIDTFNGIDLKSLVKSEDFTKSVNSLKESIIELKGAFEKGSNGTFNVKSLDAQIAEQLKDFMKEGTNKLDMKKLEENGKDFRINLVVKAVTDPIKTTGGTPVAGGLTIDQELAITPSRKPTLRSMSNVANTANMSVVYAELTNVDGTAAFVPEGGIKPSMTASLSTQTATAGLVALYATLTQQDFEDIPQLVAAIRQEIINRIDAVEEDKIMNGIGTNGEIKGIKDQLPAYTLTGLTATDANMYDAIVAAYTQIVSVSGMNYSPNAIRMNPVDYAKMQLTKNTNGDYIRPFRIGDELITGLRVVQDSGHTLGDLFMGDFSYLNIRDYVAFTIKFGWVNDDFIKNQLKVLGEKRLLCYLKSNHETAFVYDSFANIIAAITPPSA